MDYRGLLIKYMAHVEGLEGSSFLYLLDNFTEEEQAELRRIKEAVDKQPDSEEPEEPSEPLQAYEVLITDSGKVCYGVFKPSPSVKPNVWGVWIDQIEENQERIFACLSHHHTEEEALKAAVAESGVEPVEYVRVEE